MRDGLGRCCRFAHLLNFAVGGEIVAVDGDVDEDLSCGKEGEESGHAL